ncbi:hypothetical protein FQR65_LT08052 [Abscondita terminalis]|nr:hypothetical protein FQR65_LT08052 [Abscondita terminalis]
MELPRLITKPFVMARSTYSTIMKLDKRSAFVIHLSQSKTLQSTLAFLTNSTLWTSSRRSNNAHFLFIINVTNSEDVSYIFEHLWSIRIYHFAVLTCSTKSKQLIEVYTGNPFHKENECGIKAKVVNSQFCNQNLSIKFVDRYWNLNKCPIVFLTERKDYNTSTFVYHFKFFNDLAKAVNGEFMPKYYYDEIKMYNNTKRYSLTMRLENGESSLYEEGDISQAAIHGYFSCIVRAGKIISPIKTLFIIFSTKVWISILAAYVTTSIALWIISSVNEKIKYSQFEKHLLEVYFATLWGCFFLTTPQYEPGITNLEELADAKIPIYGHSRLQRYYSLHDNNSNSIYNKIKKRIKSFDYNLPQDIINKLTNEDCGIIITEFDLRRVKRKIDEKTRINSIDATIIVGKFRAFFVLPPGNYFTKSFNLFLLGVEEFVATYKHENLDKCVTRIIEDFFTEDDVIVSVYDEIVRMELPRLITKPFVMARSTYSTIMKLDKRSAFVIHLSQSKTLQSTLAFLTNSTLWTSSRRSNNAHFLFIINVTNSEDVSYIFEHLWSIRIYHFAVLTCFTNSKQLIEVYTGNPFHKENECGIKAKVVNSQFCNQNLSIKFVDRYWNLNKCSIIFLTDRKDYNIPTFVYHFKFFNDLAKAVNGEFMPKYYYDEIKMYNNTKRYSLTMRLENGESSLYEEGDISQPAIHGYFSFIVRGGKIISPIKTLFIIFSTKVWISILAAYVTTSIALWIISSVNEKIKYSQFENHLLEVYFATLWGMFLSVPRTKKIRFIILCYLVYHIHIQTGFNSRLVTVLTTPQYEPGITNLEELADAKIPLYVHSRLQRYYLLHDNNSNSIYNKIKRRIKSFDYNLPQDIINKLTNEDCGIIITEFDLRRVKRKIDEKTRINSIDATIIVGKFRAFFVLPPGNYFTKSFNLFLLGVEEFGITTRYVNEMFDGPLPDTSDFNNVVPLNLKHLFSIFVFLIIGWSLSIVVFSVEVLVSKLCTFKPIIQ